MLLINVIGILVIVSIIWWFWLYKPDQVEVDQNNFLITVENGVYQPSNIILPANTPTKLQFIRKDATPCAETLLIPKLSISETLPINKIKSIEIPGLPIGDYDFHCQMQMYRGKLEVK